MNQRDIQKATREAIAKAEALGAVMLALAEDSVEEEKSTKMYSDRTGNLVESTKAELMTDSSQVTTVKLEMGESPRARRIPYASFITDGTYGAKNTTYPSLSNFRVIAGQNYPRKLEDLLNEYFDTETGSFR